MTGLDNSPSSTSDSSIPLQRYRRLLVPGIVLILGTVAVTWLSYQFWRLVLSPLPGNGAIDLRLRWREVSAFFAGMDVNAEFNDAVYPPASYLMLWPLRVFENLTALRWSWGGFSLLILCWLVSLVVRHSEGASRSERLLLALIVLASYPVGSTVGNGQTGLVVLLCLLAGLPMVAARNRPFTRDVWIALLFLVALVKPTLSAYFFWVVLFAAASLRPAMLVCGGYVLLTYVASLFQTLGPIALMRSWLAHAVTGALYGARRGEGAIRLPEITGEQTVHITSINLHSVLSYLRYVDFIVPATFLVLGLLGAWVWLHRRCPLWILIGVSALVDRLGTYHGWYDDVILVLPLIALFRIHKGEGGAGPRHRTIAGSLFALMSVSLLAPGGIYWLPYPWNNASVVAQTTVWLGVLAFLGFSARVSLSEGHRSAG